MMRKILYALLGYFICLYLPCSGKQIDNVFTHEYCFLSLYLWSSDNQPTIINIMSEPNDTLRLNLQSAKRLIDCMDTRNLIVNELMNNIVLYDIYGMSSKVDQSDILYKNRFSIELNDKPKEQQYDLLDGSHLRVQYMKVSGVFKTIQMNNDEDMIELYGDRVSEFKSICPLHILYCIQMENLNILTYSDVEP